MSNKMTGLVKWFNADKRDFGFLSLLLMVKDVFCTFFSAIQSDNFRTLFEGQKSHSPLRMVPKVRLLAT